MKSRLREKAKSRAEIADSFELFRKKYRGRETPQHQQELHSFIEANPWCVILEPRTHGKSETATIDRTLWRVCLNRNIRILIVAKNDDMAKDFMRPIKFELANNEQMRHDFNLAPFTKETEHSIVVKRTKNLKDATVSAVGWTGSITGRKVDLIICDDLFDSKDVRTQEFRLSIKEWFFKELINCLDTNGELVVIGTTKHYDDLYQTLMRTPEFRTLRRQAIIDEEKKITLWPEKFPWDTLMKIRSVLGPIYFSAEYMNDPTPLEGELLKGEWLHYWSEYNPELPKLPKEGFDVRMGVDPAISKATTADDSGICIMVKDRQTGRMFQAKSWGGKVDFPELIELVKKEASVWHPEKIVIEENAYQASLVQQLQRSTNLPVVGYKTSKDKITRMLSLTPFFESGKLLVHENQAQFIQEYLQFPKGAHDDLLDAMFFAVAEWLELGDGSFGFVPVDWADILR